MVVKIFIGEKSKFEHEWNQFEEVYTLINNEYAKSAKLIYILTNFRLSNTEIDVLILTQKGMAIIDLKAYKGNVIGNENGNWKVIIENRKEVLLEKNLFQQLQDQKYDLRNKLNRIRIENFQHIERDLLGKIQCWGYFEKGSSYNKEQMDRAVNVWFDVITADNLIKKLEHSLNAGYELRPEDMDSIVKGLNLRPPPSEDNTFESNWKKELSVFIKPQNWDKIFGKIKDSNIITVVGSPNVGKTTTIMNIAKELKKSGYNIHEDKKSLIRLFTSRGEKDRKEYLHLIKNKNVFILDDLFGRTQYEPGLVNEWVYLIINILDSAVVQSKFIIGSRKDVMDNFLSSNNELNRWNLMNEFKNSIVELRFSDYDEKNRKEIFDKNLNFIHLNDKNKEAILHNNLEKIIRELLLPGDISYFIQKAKDKEDFRENELNSYIDRAKQQLNSVSIEISSLNDYEKIFLYNLYINQDFDADDLEVIYFQCLSFGLERNYFIDCIKKFRNDFIKIKLNQGYSLIGKLKKLNLYIPYTPKQLKKLLILMNLSVTG